MRVVIRAALDSLAARFSDDSSWGSSGSWDKLESGLRARYPALGAWPSDAQLGLFVLGWVLGPGFALPGFRQSVGALIPDFSTAAKTVESLDSRGLSPPASSLVTLRGVSRTAFGNGALVVRWNLDPDILYWPLDLSACQGATV